MKRTFALVVVAGAAAMAQGQHSLGMKADLQVFDTADSTWKDLVTVNPGTVVQMRILTSFDTATGEYDCWGGHTLNQIDVTNSSAADGAGNFGGLIRPATQTFKLYNPGAAAKIDRLDNAAGNIQLAQLSSANGGSTANPLVTFTFEYTVDSGNSADRFVGFNVTAASFSLAQIFTTSGGSSVSVPAAARVWDGAQIHVTPAPGAIALVGLSGLVAGRRRRA